MKKPRTPPVYFDGLNQFFQPLFIIFHKLICTMFIDLQSNRLQVLNEKTRVRKPEYLYGPQAIDVIMRKPGKIT